MAQDHPNIVKFHGVYYERQGGNGAPPGSSILVPTLRFPDEPALVERGMSTFNVMRYAVSLMTTSDDHRDGRSRR